jgi:chloramphenicol-sensitive protein RarD
MPDARNDSAKSRETLGFIAGIACFTTWGLIPGYWKLISNVPAAEILAHRFVWTTVFLSIVLSWQGRWNEVVATARSPFARMYCFTGGVAIASNWFLFIYAVNSGRVIETSLGYFMTPLMNVLFGAPFLRERLTKFQFVSVLLALGGVLNLTLGYGRFPWIAICICFSFGLYGLFRKKSGTTAIPGLFIETILLLPIAIGFLIYLQQANVLAFGHTELRTSILLVSTGVVTAVPLFWFGYAAGHLRLITLGFVQYLSPILSFLLGVFFFHEPFTRGQLVTFILIWIALAVFSAEAILRWRSSRVRDIDSCAFEASALD